jgi:hypothetical protein
MFAAGVAGRAASDFGDNAQQFSDVLFRQAMRLRALRQQEELDRERAALAAREAEEAQREAQAALKSAMLEAEAQPGTPDAVPSQPASPVSPVDPVSKKASKRKTASKQCGVIPLQSGAVELVPC